MDLFHGNEKTEIGPWINVEDKLPEVDRCKVRVKLQNLEEKFAYFFRDRCGWNPYVRHSYFWTCDSREPIFDVMEWKYLKKEEE